MSKENHPQVLWFKVLLLLVFFCVCFLFVCFLVRKFFFLFKNTNLEALSLCIIISHFKKKNSGLFWSGVQSLVKWSEVSQSCPTLCNPVDGSPPGSWSMGFSRQEYWSGLPFPSTGDLLNPLIEPGSPALQTDTLPSEPLGSLGNNPKSRKWQTHSEMNYR